MTGVDEADLHTLDQALLTLRRFLQAPRTVADGDQQIDLSTLLVLDAIAGHPPASIRDVAERLHVAHSTASRLVKRAIAAGTVRRAPGPDPRRAALLPTATGAALNNRAQAFRRDQLRRRLHAWTPTEIHTFSQALHRFAGGVEGL